MPKIGIKIDFPELTEEDWEMLCLDIQIKRCSSSERVNTDFYFAAGLNISSVKGIEPDYNFEQDKENFWDIMTLYFPKD